MAFRYLVIVFGVLLMGCAQVGSVSGGPQDETAPVAISIVPENESVRFHGNQIVLEFDDFVKLNSPNQTISVIPPHFKVNALANGKTVTLSWEEPLHANTTYSIYLNKTIQDITEGNDSLMQLVFSTGDVIDSLSYSTFLVDARTLSPVKGALVGLFEHPDSLRPTYFAETNASGRADLRYLKAGNYFVRSFQDDNKDLSISKAEATSFRESAIRIDSATVDSVALRQFVPLGAADLRTAQFQSPGSILVGANRSMEGAEFSFNGTVVPPAQIRQIAPDSLQLFVTPSAETTQLLTVLSENITDTVKLRLTENQKGKNFAVSPPKGNFARVTDTIRFTVPDLITAIDTSKIRIVNLADTSRIVDYAYRFERNEWLFYASQIQTEKLEISFEPEAFRGASGATNLRSMQIIQLKENKAFGTLTLNLSAYQKPIILEVLRNNTVERRLILTHPGEERIEYLEPGDYTFKVTIDSNNNGLWDTGNTDEAIQPEEIQLFSQPTKVRANWELDAELIPQP